MVSLGDQEVIKQVTASHMSALDRQLTEARQRASDRRRDAVTLASTPVAELPKVTTV